LRCPLQQTAWNEGQVKAGSPTMIHHGHTQAEWGIADCGLQIAAMRLRGEPINPSRKLTATVANGCGGKGW